MVFKVNLFCIATLYLLILQYSSDARYEICYNCGVEQCKNRQETPDGQCLGYDGLCTNIYNARTGEMYRKGCMVDNRNIAGKCHETVESGNRYIRCVCRGDLCNPRNWTITVPKANSSVKSGRSATVPKLILNNTRPAKEMAKTKKVTTTTIRYVLNNITVATPTTTTENTRTEETTRRYRSSSEESTTHSSIEQEDHLTKYSTTYTTSTEPELTTLSLDLHADITMQPEHVEEETEQEGQLIFVNTLPEFKLSNSPVIVSSTPNTEGAESEPFTPTDDDAQRTGIVELTTQELKTAATSTTGTKNFDLFSSSSTLPTPSAPTEEPTTQIKVVSTTDILYYPNFPPLPVETTTEKEPSTTLPKVFQNVTISVGDACRNSGYIIIILAVILIVIFIGAAIYVYKIRKRTQTSNDESFEMQDVTYF